MGRQTDIQRERERERERETEKREPFAEMFGNSNNFLHTLSVRHFFTV